MLIFLGNKNHSQIVTDYDGNVYATVTIGTQVWMKENLKVTHYQNGDSIAEVRDSTDWINQTSGSWCYFNNDSANGSEYGLLYNGYSVTDPRGIAPIGWHMPSDAEWKSLEMYLGMPQATTNLTDWRGANEGAMLKELDTIHWKWPTGNAATNSTGFTAFGSGWRDHFNPPGYTSFVNLTNTGQWWTSTLYNTELWMRNLCVYHTDIYRTHYPKQHGCAIRLIKDFSTGMNEINEDAEFKIFPNPASTTLNIQINILAKAQLKIINALGQEIMSKLLHNGKNIIDVSQLDNGIYFSYVTNNDRQIGFIKLIIVK